MVTNPAKDRAWAASDNTATNDTEASGSGKGTAGDEDTVGISYKEEDVQQII